MYVKGPPGTCETAQCKLRSGRNPGEREHTQIQYESEIYRSLKDKNRIKHQQDFKESGFDIAHSYVVSRAGIRGMSTAGRNHPAHAISAPSASSPYIFLNQDSSMSAGGPS